MSKTIIAAAAAALFAAGTIATASDHGEGEHREHRHRGEHRGRSNGERHGSTPRSPADPEGRALYRKECGACHLAYPPNLLPVESHRSIMAGLERHFGENAELEPAVRDRIERYLVESSGDAGAGRDRASAGGAPLRITGLRWFQKKHRDIDAGVLARPSVRSLSNCAACHAGAADWDFDDDRVKIPAS